MDSSFQIGPIVLRSQGLVIILSMLIGYFVANFRLKRIDGLENEARSRIIETIEIAPILAIAVWKLSLILFDPVRVVTNPSSLLYFSGGERGVWLAAIAVFVYFYYHSKIEADSIWLYADLLAAGFLVGMGVYSLFGLFLNSHGAWVYGGEFLITVILYQQYFRKSMGTASFKTLNQVFLWFSLGQVFVLFLNPLKQNIWWGFSKQQIVFLSLAALGIIIDFIVANRTKDMI